MSNITLAVSRNVTTAYLKNTRWWLGILLVSTLALCAIELSHVSWFQQTQISPLTLGIVLGVIVGNSLFPHIAHHTDHGVDYAKSWLLKAGVILFGFRITFSQVASVGWQGLLIDAVMLSGTFLLALYLAKRCFKLDDQTAILIGAGSSICGAAAVMATEPVIKAQAHKVSIAVATVVVFGTLSMFTYPLLYPVLGLSEHSYGLLVGSTIHEVAQVVAAGSAVSEHAADIAVIEKMLRVMLLAPFLFALSFWYQKKHTQTVTDSSQSKRLFIPWFALLFILACGVNSLGLISLTHSNEIAALDNILLTMAMAALGLRTHVGAIRQAGIKPLLLAGCLFVFLTVGGYFINGLIRAF
ncbi:MULTISPECIES: YeiH family protein [unclassified Vibrio]|uniref:YeiH family protein n=1 Tax=Vibrio sp. HB236076 TaxID=3232307 RepID=A0AB39H9I3_9VIBR|nr:YeiH family protein [Vibrio sp. HB161653]MDP5254128.1 YeiH family protein [Vibrio sp. HB161653]